MRDTVFLKKKITFETFLCGTPARDYVFPAEPYEKQIERAKRAIAEADCVLVGAGAGMSTAAGAQYGGSFFEENFGEFQKKYGNGPYMHDMYSAGFYPYPDEESYWGYWSKHAILGGIRLDVTGLHRTLIDGLADKDLFVLSTNVDRQFVKAGLPEEKNSVHRAIIFIYSVQRHAMTRLMMPQRCSYRWLRREKTAAYRHTWCHAARYAEGQWT